MPSALPARIARKAVPPAVQIANGSVVHSAYKASSPPATYSIMSDSDALNTILKLLARQTPDAHAELVAAIDRLETPEVTLNTPAPVIGMTPLGAACFFRNIPAIQKMCTVGASTRIRDEFKLLPADWGFNIYTPARNFKLNLANGHHAGATLRPGAHDDLVTANLLNAIICNSTKHRAPLVSKSTLKAIHADKLFKLLLRHSGCTCNDPHCACSPPPSIIEGMEHHAASDGAHDLTTFLQWTNAHGSDA
jgi:hypothetical protein